MDLGAVEVDDPADLAEVVLGVGLDLFLGQLGAGLVAAGGVADEGGIVADDDDGRVTEVLELAELPRAAPCGRGARRCRSGRCRT